MRLRTGVDSGRKIPCHTGESNLRRRPTGPMHYQLSYIPTLQHQSLRGCCWGDVGAVCCLGGGGGETGTHRSSPIVYQSCCFPVFGLRSETGTRRVPGPSCPSLRVTQWDWDITCSRPIVSQSSGFTMRLGHNVFQAHRVPVFGLHNETGT